MLKISKSNKGEKSSLYRKDIKTEYLIELRNNGLSYKKIGKMASMSEAGVEHRIKKFIKENSLINNNKIQIKQVFNFEKVYNLWD